MKIKSSECFIANVPRYLGSKCYSLPRSRRLSSTNTQRTLQMRTMRFRPCIDLHAGRVKQIVGGTLRDDTSSPQVNYETTESASYFAGLYARDRLPGGHVIMLGPGNERQAMSALQTYPGGMHVGGGIHPENAGRFLDYGASHVIVTSYVFRDGDIAWDRVNEMVDAVGRNRLVLDISCRIRNGTYYVCTNRWQRWTQFQVNEENVGRLGELCDELLVHAVDVEGKCAGIDLNLVEKLSHWTPCPTTYAGGATSITDLNLARDAGRGLIDVTIGSALDIFGGPLRYADTVAWQREEEARTR